MSGDDTQHPHTEPGCDDVPPIVRICSNDDAVEFTMSPGFPPHPPSGICIVGDGWSDVVSSSPNGNDSLDWERIVGVCQYLQRTPEQIWRIEQLLGLHAIGDNSDRIGSIAKSLGDRRGYIANAEQLIQMGS